MKKAFFLILTISVCLAAFLGAATLSASASNNPNAYGSGYSAVLYDNTNGLPTSDVNAVAQTPEGFFWIGSYSGLIRYDGKEFYRYDSSFGVSSVVSLFVDSRDRLWIGTNDSGVFLLEGDTFRAFNDGNGLRSLSIRSMAEDNEGNLIVATTMGLSYLDASGSLSLLDDPRVNREYVCELVRSGDVVYGVTDKGALFTLKRHTVMEYYTGLPVDGTILSVYPDPEAEGYLYLGTDAACVYRGKLSDSFATATVQSVLPRRNVRDIKLFGDSLWVCSDDGIGFLREGVYTSLDTLPMNNSVEKIFVDFEENLWFTSSRQGLMKIVRNRFDRLISLAPRVVNSVYKQDGIYYIGTDDGLVLLNEDRMPLTGGLASYLGSTRIRSVQGDSSRRIWFGTGTKGVVCYDPATGVIKTYDEDAGLSNKHARVAKELSDGRIAVATKGGVNLIVGEAVTAAYGRESGVNNLDILCLEEGPNGEIYAGSDGDGIYVIDGAAVSRIGRADGLSSEVILRMKRDPADPSLYWIITSNSIEYMKDGVITIVTGFPYSNNFDLYFDASSRMWILSGNGVYVVKRDAMLRNEKIDYLFYDASDGLPSAATANSYSFLDADGTLYIAASAVGSTNVNDDYDYDESVRLAVPYVLADDRYLSVTDGKVTVPSSCKRLVIGAYAFTYSLNNPHLTYRLEGFDEEATEVLRRDMSPITYTNLSGGRYTFVLSLINTMTGETEKTFSVTIVKEKKVTEQIWFWVLVALVGAAAVVGVALLFFRAKTRKLLRQREHDREVIDEITSVFASCIDMKDPYTNGHSHRVAKITAMIAERMGKSKEEVEQYYRTALLHDIGKIAIPDKILNKPERLTDEEFAVMKSHSQRGYDILKDVKIVPDLAVGVGYHHERQDGKGYPRGLKKEEIPFVAQIIAVADTFDAMYSTRPYRKSLTIEQVANEIKRCSGAQLNPEIVDVLLKLIEEKAIEPNE